MSKTKIYPRDFNYICDRCTQPTNKVHYTVASRDYNLVSKGSPAALCSQCNIVNEVPDEDPNGS